MVEESDEEERDEEERDRLVSIHLSDSFEEDALERDESSDISIPQLFNADLQDIKKHPRILPRAKGQPRRKLRKRSKPLPNDRRALSPTNSDLPEESEESDTELVPKTGTSFST